MSRRKNREKQVSQVVSSEVREVENRSESPVISKKRVWMFRLVAMVFAVAVVFFVPELVLRLAGYGYEPKVFLRCEVHGKSMYCQNNRYAQQYFPSSLAREFYPMLFSAEKPEDVYRIFVLGASAAAGNPDGAFSFGRILEVMLNERYPRTRFEVIVVAMPAINSHAVYPMSRDCLEHDADMLVVYLGNNEVVGPYGAGTVFDPLSPHIGLIRSGIYLKGTRLGQLAGRVLESVKKTPGQWLGLEMFLDRQVRRTDPSLEVVYQNFDRNLRDMLLGAAAEGVPVVLCTVGSNLRDCSPLSSLHREGLVGEALESWEDLYQQGIDQQEKGEYESALVFYEKARQIDGDFADLYHRMGRCREQLGQYGLSKENYVLARDCDTLRFRADSRINEIIKEAAVDLGGRGVYLADVESALGRSCEHGLPGWGLFHEHVHMRFSGNVVTAWTILEAMEGGGAIKAAANQAKGEVLSEADCARLLVHDGWNEYVNARGVYEGHIQHPPFTNQYDHEMMLKRWEDYIAWLKETYTTTESLQETAGRYEQAIHRSPEDIWFREKYARFLHHFLKDYASAYRQNEWLTDHVPDYVLGFYSMGLILVEQGYLKKAEDCFRKAIEIKPNYWLARYRLGLVMQMQGDLSQAIVSYKGVLKFNPEHENSYVNMGVLLMQLKKGKEAIALYEKAVELLPKSSNIHYNLGLLLAQRGQYERAVGHLKKASELSPENPKIKEMLHKILKAGGVDMTDPSSQENKREP